MEGIMAFWENRSLSDDGVIEFVQQLIRGEHLDGSAASIAQQFVDPNARPLTDNQEFRLKVGIAENGQDRCSDPECRAFLDWDEMYEAVHGVDGDGLCAQCRDTQ
jgi:hypothetical protein